MAKETKYYCDRCKKEYDNKDKHWIKYPRFEWGFKIGELTASYYKVDLCYKCWEEAKGLFYNYGFFKKKLTKPVV